MHIKKQTYSDEVTHTVCQMCKLVFNLNTDKEINKVLGITYEQMKSSIEKIIESLPDNIFEQSYPALLEEIKNISAREFIFFQVQERWDDPQYQDNLKMFIHVFSRDIQQRVDAATKFPSSEREK